MHSSLAYPLIDENWMSLDELLLLDGFEKWGFGNWAEVKDYMGHNGANFNKNYLRSHYDEHYLNEESILPAVDETLKINYERVIRQARKVQIEEKINEPIFKLVSLKS